jgi:hypothetical protein
VNDWILSRTNFLGRSITDTTFFAQAIDSPTFSSHLTLLHFRYSFFVQGEVHNSGGGSPRMQGYLFFSCFRDVGYVVGRCNPPLEQPLSSQLSPIAHAATGYEACTRNWGLMYHIVHEQNLSENFSPTGIRRAHLRFVERRKA